MLYSLTPVKKRQFVNIANSRIKESNSKGRLIFVFSFKSTGGIWRIFRVVPRVITHYMKGKQDVDFPVVCLLFSEAQ